MNERTISIIFIAIFAALGVCCIAGVVTGHPRCLVILCFCGLMIWALIRQANDDVCLSFADLDEIYSVVMHTKPTEGEPYCEQVDLSNGRFAVVEYTVLRNYDTGKNDVFVVAATLNDGGWIHDITDDIRNLFND